MIARLATSKGYSMLEMVVVLGIIALVTAVAVPNFIQWNQKYQLKSDVSNLAQMLSIARMTAINQNLTVNVWVCHLQPICPGTAPNPTPAQVTVFFINPLGTPPLGSGLPGAPILGFSTTNERGLNAMNTAVSLSNVGGALVGAGVQSPQIVTFLPTGMWTNVGNLGNNICLGPLAPFAPGACGPTTTQVLNFRNPSADNYRIVIKPTGKVTWCYSGNCVA